MINIPAQYSYTILSACIFLIWIIFFLLNKIFRKRQIILSSIFMIFGPLSEALFIPDYWHPITIWSLPIFKSYMSPEDLIFCFSMIGIIASFNNLAFDRPRAKDAAISWNAIGYLLICTAALSAACVLLWLAGINSIFATSLGMVGVAAAVMLWARDIRLIYPALAGAVFVPILLFGLYWTGFKSVENSEAILKSIWSLYGTRLGVRLAGVPLTELLWGASFGFVFSTLFSRFKI